MIGAMGRDAQRFMGHAGVQQNGCEVLAMLADDNDENSVAIVAAGGVAAVIGGMGRFEGHAGVQQDGCMALRNLALNGKEGRKRINEIGRASSPLHLTCVFPHPN